MEKRFITYSYSLHIIGYTGKNCEENIDDCESVSCEHGTCQDEINAFHCECDRGTKRNVDNSFLKKENKFSSPQIYLIQTEFEKNKKIRLFPDIEGKQKLFNL